VILEIEDNGVGIRPEQSQDRQSWGIIGMRERVRALDGEFSVEEIWEGGTRVLVRIPVGLSPPD
jgi:signal transduction histidine kinase